jgi:hypothetical protein
METKEVMQQINAEFEYLSELLMEGADYKEGRKFYERKANKEFEERFR